MYPYIDGLDDFAGVCFHSSRWPENLSLGGKRVAVIGTGSTATQLVTAIVSQVAHLSLFQRTAQWILPVPNPPIGELPYLLTMGPHSFYWFKLESADQAKARQLDG